MPSNISLAAGGGVKHSIVPKKSYQSLVGQIWASICDIYPNCFYFFDTLDQISVTLKEDTRDKFNHFMYEFTTTTDDASFYLFADKPIYWPRPIEIKGGYKYQISILNGIVLWTGVAVQ